MSWWVSRSVLPSHLKPHLVKHAQEWTWLPYMRSWRNWGTKMTKEWPMRFCVCSKFEQLSFSCGEFYHRSFKSHGLATMLRVYTQCNIVDCKLQLHFPLPEKFHLIIIDKCSICCLYMHNSFYDIGEIWDLYICLCDLFFLIPPFHIAALLPNVDWRNERVIKHKEKGWCWFPG